LEKDILYLIELANVQLNESEDVPKSWIHLLLIGEYTHPVYGKLSMTSERIKNFAENVKKRVRGIDPSINLMHGDKVSGDGEAAGWIKDAEARHDGLWALVEWVKSTAQDIKEKKWRYISAEFREKWADPAGKSFSDVLFGGALTNRPYMKNLLPINLSENSIHQAFELVDAINRAKQTHKEEDVDLKKLTELLGLPEGTTEEAAFAKLAETLKAPPAPPAPPKAPPTVPKVDLSTELKKLAEENPMVKTLIETVDAQEKALNDFQVSLREADVSRKLAEFDTSKIILTPRAKDLVHDLLLDIPVELSEQFWELLNLMRNSTSFMVEIGERAGANVRYGRSKDSKQLFMSESQRIADEKKIALTEAMSIAASQNPELYNGYRQEAFSFRD